jgi:hypothetical protein
MLEKCVCQIRILSLHIDEIGPLRIEHEELHALLRKATTEQGELGETAKAVTKLWLCNRQSLIPLG